MRIDKSEVMRYVNSHFSQQKKMLSLSRLKDSGIKNNTTLLIVKNWEEA